MLIADLASTDADGLGGTHLSALQPGMVAPKRGGEGEPSIRLTTDNGFETAEKR